MGSFKLATLVGITEMQKTAGAPAYLRMDPAALKGQLDSELSYAANALNHLEHMKGVIPEQEWQQQFNAATDHYSNMAHMKRTHDTKLQIAHGDSEAAAGRLAPTPRKADWAHRLSGGLVGRGEVAGPDVRHRDGDIAAIGHRLRGLRGGADGGQGGWFSRMGPLGKAGVIGGGVIGGGLLLKSLMAPSRPERERQVMY